MLTDDEKTTARELTQRLWAFYKDVPGAHASARHSRQGRFLRYESVLIDASRPGEMFGVAVIVPDEGVKSADVKVVSAGDEPRSNGSVQPTIEGGRLVQIREEPGPWWDVVREAMDMAIDFLDMHKETRAAEAERAKRDATNARAADLLAASRAAT